MGRDQEQSMARSKNGNVGARTRAKASASQVTAGGRRTSKAMERDTIALAKMLQAGCTLEQIEDRFSVGRTQAHEMMKRVEGSLSVKIAAEGRGRARVYRCESAGLLTLELPAHEAIPALLLLRDATGSLLAPALKGAATFGTKILGALEPSEHRRFESLKSRVSLRFIHTRAASAAIYERFVEAMLAGRTLSLDYAKAGSMPTLAAKPVGAAVAKPWIVEPWAVFYARRHLYAIINPCDPSSKPAPGPVDKFSRLRTVKLSRVRSATLGATAFTVPAWFTLNEYLSEAWEVIRTSDAPLSTVVIDVDPAWAENLIDTSWHSTQKVERSEDGSVNLTANGKVRMTFKVRGFNEIKHWILWLGRGASVVQPEALRTAVLDELKAMTERHSA